MFLMVLVTLLTAGDPSKIRFECSYSLLNAVSGMIVTLNQPEVRWFSKKEKEISRILYCSSYRLSVNLTKQTLIKQLICNVNCTISTIFDFRV
jgi:hypothetical protein